MIRVLAVDDSALMRRVLNDILSAEPDMEVALARDGVEAWAQILDFKPDVITLDMQMPRMDGLACLEQIMRERPCPVIMLSSLTGEGADTTLQALALGAVDFLPKPSGTVTLALDDLAPILVAKVRTAAQAQLRRASWRPGRTTSPPPARSLSPRRRWIAPPTDEPAGLVLVGVSTGGPPALEALLGVLPADFPWPVLVAQHMPAGFTASLADRLDRLCPMQVVEVTAPTSLLPGRVHIGRGDADLVVRHRGGKLVALPMPSSPDHRWHPSVERLVTSAAALVSPERLIGVMLTGMGYDGAAAMAKLRREGGYVVAEHASTAVVWGMPGELVRLGGADVEIPVHEIGQHLVDRITP